MCRVHSFSARSMDLGGSSAVPGQGCWVDFGVGHLSVLAMVPEVGKVPVNVPLVLLYQLTSFLSLSDHARDAD